MCGIAGVFSLGAPLGDAEFSLVKAMTGVLRHRGPDSQGFLHDERAALGNSRLRVTDLSAGADLPLASENGALWLAYNGAVTNFRGLAREYGFEKKRPLRTSSDSEVVLRLYEELGGSFLDKFSGQFAFALYDRARSKALVVRDFYGLRPVFYLVHGGRVYFASEIKALLEVNGWDRALDREALWHFFSLAYLPGRHTPFSAIRELPAGHMLEVDLAAGALAEKPYYRLAYEPDAALTEEGAAAGMRSRLLNSVEASLAVDVPAGLTLSGGVDTSSLLGLAKHLGLSERLHTFSIVMGEKSFDESRYQRLMARFAGSIHHELRVEPRDVLENLVRTIAHLDEPTGDGAAVPSFLLAREARKHVGVLLSGEGGDEVSNAYETHRACRARAAYRRLVPGWARKVLRGGAQALPVSCSKLSFDFLAKRFTEGAELGVPEAHLYWRHALGEEAKERLLAFPRPAGTTAQLFREFYDALPYTDELDRISHLDLWYYFVDDLMVKNDRSIMAHSVETRFPFMEREVVEFSARIPSAFKVKGLRGRCVQKRAMRGLLPPEILARSNMGLEMPHSLWFFGEFREIGERYFSREQVSRSGLLNWEAVDGLWREHLARRRDNGRPLWCILNFLIWFDLFVYDGNYKQFLQKAGNENF
ncbi:MAG TPA: asparagine synthase (glutamine-hydrolyzing) [Elusimicrobiales bacterium]|nr:asparagine synthase (glutamine-hydrolyzing) [Elusimicrobiales bacterium]